MRNIYYFINIYIYIILSIFIVNIRSRLYESRVRDHVVHLGLNVSSSAHNCGCVVDGGGTVAAI